MVKQEKNKLSVWFYEALPYLYAGFGLVAAVLLDSVLGRISGLMLITAGGMIWRLRRQYRKQRMRPVKRNLGWIANRDK